VSSQHTSPCKEDITGQERKAQLKTNALFAIRYNTLLHLVTEESHEMGSCLFVCLFFGGFLQPQGRERGTFGQFGKEKSVRSSVFAATKRL
jgi:hypothetical protein